MKEQIEKIYIQALIDDLPPNVFADKVLRLFDVSYRHSCLQKDDLEFTIALQEENTLEAQALNIPVVSGSTHLVVIRDWISPYNSNMKGNHAPAEYWAKKLGKDTNTFVKDFENGCLDQWFKVYYP